MEYISSDTNVWIDFNIISRMNLPFLLPYTYIMYTESMESELLNPEGFKDQLAEAGLVGVDITIEEFLLAQSWGPLYPKLSIQDRIALAIAKQRDITLLTGDKALRMAAAQEGVHVIGTLGILRPPPISTLRKDGAGPVILMPAWDGAALTPEGMPSC